MSQSHTHLWFESMTMCVINKTETDCEAALENIVCATPQMLAYFSYRYIFLMLWTKLVYTSAIVTNETTLQGLNKLDFCRCGYTWAPAWTLERTQTLAREFHHLFYIHFCTYKYMISRFSFITFPISDNNLKKKLKNRFRQSLKVSMSVPNNCCGNSQEWPRPETMILQFPVWPRCCVFNCATTGIYNFSSIYFCSPGLSC